MRNFKKAAVLTSVLLFVALAVYLNWSYNKKEEDVSANAETTLAEEPELEEAGLFYEKPEEVKSVSAYFETVRLNRSRARDEAVQTLSNVSETEGASQETVDMALAEISQVAEYSMMEAELEGLILAKGFEECVVFITDDGVDVTVPASSDGLSTAEVARITDAVLSETNFTADNLKIVEVRG